MRVVFGIVGLLVVVAIAGLLAKQQLQATRQSVSAVAPAASGANVAEQARQVQQQFKADLGKALQQGADARGAEADK